MKLTLAGLSSVRKNSPPVVSGFPLDIAGSGLVSSLMITDISSLSCCSLVSDKLRAFTADYIKCLYRFLEVIKRCLQVFKLCNR